MDLLFRSIVCIVTVVFKSLFSYLNLPIPNQRNHFIGTDSRKVNKECSLFHGIYESMKEML